jgi:5-methylcytosine-specific restriction enzyme subunit McrC
MLSDITLEYENRILIIDAKYYKDITQEYYGKPIAHSPNIYQIFTYVKNKEVELKDKDHVVSGMLLYAGTDEYIQTDVSYMMSGNKITIKTLDLNQDFNLIKEQLDGIVNEYLLG